MLAYTLFTVELLVTSPILRLMHNLYRPSLNHQQNPKPNNLQWLPHQSTLRHPGIQAVPQKWMVFTSTSSAWWCGCAFRWPVSNGIWTIRLHELMKSIGFVGCHIYQPIHIIPGPWAYKWKIFLAWSPVVDCRVRFPLTLSSELVAGAWTRSGAYLDKSPANHSLSLSAWLRSRSQRSISSN